MCSKEPASTPHRQQRSEVEGKHLCNLVGVRYHLEKSLKLVSCSLVQDEDFIAKVMIRCFCTTEKVRLRSDSHLSKQRKLGYVGGEFKRKYICERVWEAGPASEQHSSKVVSGRENFCGSGIE